MHCSGCVLEFAWQMTTSLDMFHEKGLYDRRCTDVCGRLSYSLQYGLTPHASARRVPQERRNSCWMSYSGRAVSRNVMLVSETLGFSLELSPLAVISCVQARRWATHRQCAVAGVWAPSNARQWTAWSLHTLWLHPSAFSAVTMRMLGCDIRDPGNMTAI